MCGRGCGVGVFGREVGWAGGIAAPEVDSEPSGCGAEVVRGGGGGVLRSVRRTGRGSFHVRHGCIVPPLL